MKRYEGLFILNISGKEDGVKDTLDKVSSDITAAGGKVETVQKMDKKSFARVADKAASKVDATLTTLREGDHAPFLWSADDYTKNTNQVGI